MDLFEKADLDLNFIIMEEERVTRAWQELQAFYLHFFNASGGLNLRGSAH